MRLLSSFLHFLIPDNYFDSKDDETEGKTIEVCPKCLLPDLQYVREVTSGWMTPPRKFCPHCGYSGILTLEIDLNEYNSVPPENRIEWIREMRLKAFVDDSDEDSGFDFDNENARE